MNPIAFVVLDWEIRATYKPGFFADLDDGSAGSTDSGDVESHKSGSELEISHLEQ